VQLVGFIIKQFVTMHGHMNVKNYTGHLSSLHLGYVLTYRLLHVPADTAINTDRHVSPNMII
jgi:hypothetical protein